jgi:hypothetical protein
VAGRPGVHFDEVECRDVVDDEWHRCEPFPGLVCGHISKDQHGAGAVRFDEDVPDEAFGFQRGDEDVFLLQEVLEVLAGHLTDH